jgi:beta-galactosidase GanA
MTLADSSQGSTRSPHLRKQGSATQLVVGGEPFLVIGGELHNSSASSLAYMQPIWERLVALNMNTVLAPVFWELIEPEEGKFDFTLVDGLVHEARLHGLRLILLWFGSWKNGMSSYIPLWAKQDYRRFPRIARRGGETVEVLSTLAEANWQADAKAFAALMGHLRELDSDDQTVIMVQVENEVGVLGDTRDHSEAAERAFAAPVPQELIDQLQQHAHELGDALRQRWDAAGRKTAGSWEEVFGSGPETDEIFMAWNYARYVDNVVVAGKAAYDIPMFVNAWLSNPQETAGFWPSGGPLPHTLDIWLAGAPHIDLLTPDIYQPNFAEWCRGYCRRGNALFIPEMMPTEVGARNVFYAIGQHDAIGTSPFAIDSLIRPDEAHLGKSYALLRQLAPVILAHQGGGATAGFLLDEANPSVTRDLGEYEVEISLDDIFGFKASIGYGLIIATGPQTFIGAGSGFGVAFRHKSGGAARVGIAAVDEGEFRDGEWVPGRRLNGDENDQGRKWRFPGQLLGIQQPGPQQLGIQRCTVYHYE